MNAVGSHSEYPIKVYIDSHTEQVPYLRCYAEISLENVRHNMLEVRKRTPEGVKLLAVVKADAYGHGAVQVAKARLLTMESDHVEFVFDDPIPRGTYFIAVYTRHGKDTGYAPTRICRQIKTLPRARR